jgi:hypothetical protein
MKSILFLLAIALSCITNVFAGTSDSTSVAVPQSFEIEPSIDASPKPPSAKLINGAATHYWVCIAVSSRTGRYGWSQGGSESSALGRAKSNCGGGDCKNFWMCQESGCVGIDYGHNYVSISRATGYGLKDGSKAASKALSTCKAHSFGCGKPGHFCSKYVV